ncbi:MAG: hypothetical protein ACXV8I_11890 [Methylobacter sp.]
MIFVTCKTMGGRLPPLLLMGHILGFKLLAEAFVSLLRDQESDILCSLKQ